MDSVEQTLQVMIQLKLIGEDQAEAARKALKSISDGSVETGVSTKNLANETKGLTEATEKSEISHRELKKAMFDIGNIAAPGMGAAISELALGPFGAVLALSGAVELVKNNLNAASDAADKFAEEVSQPMLQSVKDITQAWDDNIKAIADYQAALKTAGEDKDPIKTQIDNLKQLTAAKLESLKQIAQASGASPAQLNSIQKAIDSNAGAGSLTGEYTQREAHVGSYIDNANAAQGTAAAAAAAAGRGKSELANIRNLLDPNSAEGKAAAARRDAAQRDLESAQNQPDTFYYEGGASAPNLAKPAAIAAAQAQVDVYAKEADNLRTRAAQLEAQQEQLEEAARIAATNAETARQESINNQARLRELPGLISQASAVQSAKESGTEGVQLLNTHLQGTNKTLADYTKAAGLTAEQTVNIVNRLLTHQLTIAEAQNGLAQRIQQLESRLNYLSHHQSN